MTSPGTRVPQAHFDLIHARLVLVHLPERAAVLRRLVAALRPGGWLALEDFDLQLIPHITAGGTADEKLMNKVWDALIALLVSRGADPCYGRKLPALLDDAGLAEVQADGHLAIARGGSAGARLQQANVDQTRDQLAASCLVTGDEITRFHDLLDDPSTAFMKPVLISARGQQPRQQGR
jgi:SAM-dependent methyltransferase